MENDEEDCSLFVDASDQEESFLLEVVAPGELMIDEDDGLADVLEDGDGSGEERRRSRRTADERELTIDPNISGSDAAVNTSDELLVERTIRRMQETSVCLHPKHSHSFQPVHFVLFKSCFVCQRRLPLYASGAASASGTTASSSGNAVVRCVACGAVAHRACTTGEGTEAIPVCAVNRARIEGLNLGDQDREFSTDDQQCSRNRGLEESFECAPEDVLVEGDLGANHEEEKWSRVKSKKGSSANEIPTIAFPETHHLSSPSSSPPRRNDAATGNPSTNDNHALHSPAEGDTARDNNCQSSSAHDVEGDEFDGNVHVSSLHYAKHPFASISRALQENVLALHARLRSGHQLLPSTDDECSSSIPLPESPEPPSKEETALSSGVGSPSNETAVSAMGGGGDTVQTNHSRTPPNPIVHLASQTLELVKSSVAGPAATAIVAGGAIAGGVAGLALAGPAGAYAGCLGGASALGVILEGGVSIGVLVGSIAMGGYTASQVNASHQMRRQRVLTMGEEGTARKVLLVRPQLPDADPVWDAIYAEARRSAPNALNAISGSANNTPFASLVFRKQNDEKQIIRDRYRRDADILQNTEEEVPTKDKVLLLVSRMLSDKSSLPGYVYRYLMDAFLDRDEARQSQPDGFTSVTADDSPGGANQHASSRIRRDDVHAVIRYVTAAVLEFRPGLGATADLTELSAGAVETLIFGRLYDLVFVELVQETAEMDESLVAKIRRFHEDISNRSNEKFPRGFLFVSEGAIDALHMIPKAHSAVDKLYFCVLFLERISDFYLENADSGNSDGNGPSSSGACADSLLKLTCQHIIAAQLPAFNAEVAFLEEFARDEQLLRGREGYALVTLQASLHFLNFSDNMIDIFEQDDDEENVQVESSSLTSSSSSEVSLSPQESGIDEREDEALLLETPTQLSS